MFYRGEGGNMNSRVRSLSLFLDCPSRTLNRLLDLLFFDPCGHGHKYYGQKDFLVYFSKF